MPSAEDGDAPALEPGTAEVLQAATRVLAGVALRSLDVLDSAVTLPQFRLLAVLADLGPAPSGRAARALGLDPSTITRLADRMVAAGHVARGADPQHRGVVTLRLTATGRGLVASADAWRRRELARIMARLAPPERAAVTDALGLLVGAAGDDYGITVNPPVPLLAARRPAPPNPDKAIIHRSLKALLMAIGILAATLGLLISAAAIIIPRIVNRGNNPEDHTDSVAYLRQTGRTAQDIARGNARRAFTQNNDAGSQQAGSADGPTGNHAG